MFSGRRTDSRARRWSRRSKVIAATAGAVLASTAAFAATNWIVGLSTGSSGEAQANSISNLSIDAISSPAAGNLLYPGATGDVVVKITNPNKFPVTITGVTLPTTATGAAGYTDSALTLLSASCTAASSTVTYTGAGATATSKTLATPLTIAAAGGSPATLLVTLTNETTMGSTAPAGCASTYFKMPSFTGVTATSALPTDTVTTSPATDTWP